MLYNKLYYNIFSKRLNMNTLYLVRHGENFANITKQFSHRVIDLNLTEKGEMQAKQTGMHFKNVHIDELYSSPLIRAKQTADEISKNTNLKYVIVENLRELNVGALETSPAGQSEWQLHNEILSSWVNGDMTKSFPEGENGFSLCGRFKEALYNIFFGKENKAIAVVGHAGIFTYGMINLCCQEDVNIIKQTENNNCSISTFKIEAKNNMLKCKLIKWADVTHLYGDAANFVSAVPRY